MKTRNLGAWVGSAALLSLVMTHCGGGGQAPTRNSQLNGGPSGSGSSNGGASSGTAIASAQNTATTGDILMAAATSGGSGGTMESCQQTSVEFTPDIPTVMILVDQSSSMWDNMFWNPLRDGVLQVVQRLNQDVRFGFASFTGVMGQTCPLDLSDLGTIDLNNYQPIADFYNALAQPNQATETPTPAAVQSVTQTLLADNETFPGPKFILLVTDGMPDYCDNGQVECRADTLVRALQDAYAAGIGTFVVALPDPGINQDWLTAFANAGAGQSVLLVQDTQYCGAIPAGTDVMFPYPFPQGTYGASMGPATHFNVDPANQDELVNQIASVVAGVKSCVFDLQGELTIVPGLEGEGKVTISTQTDPNNPDSVVVEEQPYDPSGVDGWTVNGGTQVELVGSSCDKLRDPNTVGIDFGFPCNIVVPK